MRSLLLWLLSGVFAVAAALPVSAAAPKPAVAPVAKSKVEAPATKPKVGAAPAAPIVAAAPDAGTPRAPFRWDVPGLVDQVDSPGIQVSDGVPMHLQLARSRWQLDALIQAMADRFRAAGLFISTSPEALSSPTREPILTALDTEKRVAYTVIFQQGADGLVTLILGTSDLSSYKPASPLGWAPVMAGAEQVTRTEMEAGQMAMFSVNASPAQVLEFYRTELGAAGFREDPAQPGLFQRGTEVLRVVTRQDGDSVVVGLNRRLGVAESDFNSNGAP
jgi:hypothetical protein